MNGHPTVSFVVPCYNYARYLPDCLTSIFRQDGDHAFEIIAVDDGSTDNTVDVLHEFADPRLRVIVHRTNLGHVAAIHTGLEQARGEFIARIDPDDRYRPHFLSATLEKFRAHPEVGLVYGDAAVIDEHGNLTIDKSDRQHGGQDYRGNELVPLLAENYICAPTVIARREAWLKTLPVPAHLAFHDWYFTVMIAREWDFYYVHRVLADYRVHSNNWHTRIATDKSEERSVMWLLDSVFAGEEARPELECAKQAGRRQIYGAQYLAAARKYFGFGLYADARRCFLRAIRNRPRYLLQGDVLRQLFATFIGRTAYERSKTVFKQRIAGLQ